MDHVERIDRKLIHAGAIVDFYDDTMRLPDGKIEHWDMVCHRKGAAAVLPVLEDGRILMVHQFRPALDRETIEIPAGSRDSVDEDTLVCATRELEEETGYVADSIELLLKLRTTVAFCDEFIDVYLAKGVRKEKEQQLDEAEAIEIEAYSLPELLRMVYGGIIQDSKTVSAILAYANQVI